MGFLISSAAEDNSHDHHQILNVKRRSKILAASSSSVRAAFQILTTTLLSLLLPLSVLILARLSTAHYLLSVSSSDDATNDHPSTTTTSMLSSLFLYTKKPNILHFIVSILSVASLTHSLTGISTALFPITTQLTPSERLPRRRLYVAWILLITLQICVGLGIEGSIAVGVDGSEFDQVERSLLITRVIFFFGLHETTLFWRRAVVKPVVDDTLFGLSRMEGWPEKVVMGMSYGGLWWWRLRDEVESLVIVPEVKRELMMGIGVADFVGWWLYYLTFTIGMVRMVKGLVFTVAMLTRCRRNEGESRLNDDDDDKV